MVGMGATRVPLTWVMPIATTRDATKAQPGVVPVVTTRGNGFETGAENPGLSPGTTQVTTTSDLGYAMCITRGYAHAVRFDVLASTEGNQG